MHCMWLFTNSRVHSARDSVRHMCRHKKAMPVRRPSAHLYMLNVTMRMLRGAVPNSCQRHDNHCHDAPPATCGSMWGMLWFVNWVPVPTPCG